MIECKAYGCTFGDELVCIRRQQKLVDIKAKARKKHRGVGEVLHTCFPPAYYKIEKCDSCFNADRLYACNVYGLQFLNRRKK